MLECLHIVALACTTCVSCFILKRTYASPRDSITVLSFARRTGRMPVSRDKNDPREARTANSIISYATCVNCGKLGSFCTTRILLRVKLGQAPRSALEEMRGDNEEI